MNPTQCELGSITPIDTATLLDDVSRLAHNQLRQMDQLLTPQKQHGFVLCGRALTLQVFSYMLLNPQNSLTPADAMALPNGMQCHTAAPEAMQ